MARDIGKVVASVEARIGSSRFPGKVLADINGKPALGRLLDRLLGCRTLADIVIATSVDPADDAIETWAKSEGVALYRGSEDDVLQRVVDAQRSRGADTVVEITGDATLTDPAIVDLAVETYRSNDCDVVSTAWVKSYPIGIDAQVFSFAALDGVARTIFDPPVREHVSLHFYENPERYRIINLAAPPPAREPELRLTLDYREDQTMIAAIYAALEPRHGGCFGVREVVSLLRASPDLLGSTQGLAIKAVRRDTSSKPSR
ncbi:MAG TPA: hypothetical protein VMY41_18890 [Thermohalobaculum sp.]|nr:hypothetical protein [Thermohalobaculum sp.]